MIATIYLNEVTCIDHAYIDDKGVIRGGSFLPSFEVSGTTDNSESVVLDFSKAKKWIKEQIDHPEDGFDHKLWFIEGYSNGSYRIEGAYYVINTPTASLRVPIDAVKIFYAQTYSVQEIGEVIERYLKERTKDGLFFVCHNSEEPVLPKNSKRGLCSHVRFRYVHGLKDSSSWGCQNIAHGHSSYLMVNEYVDLPVIEDTLFVYAPNIIRETASSITIGYETPRGSFTMVVEREFYKVIILKEETTIENLVAYFNDALTILGYSYDKLWVSEGLQKGACIHQDKNTL